MEAGAAGAVAVEVVSMMCGCDGAYYVDPGVAGAKSVVCIGTPARHSWRPGRTPAVAEVAAWRAGGGDGGGGVGRGGGERLRRHLLRRPERRWRPERRVRRRANAPDRSS